MSFVFLLSNTTATMAPTLFTSSEGISDFEPQIASTNETGQTFLDRRINLLVMASCFEISKSINWSGLFYLFGDLLLRVFLAAKTKEGWLPSCVRYLFVLLLIIQSQAQ